MPHPMTPKEAELLRAVAEAAAAMIVRWDTEGMASASEIRTATHALTAYRAQPQEAEGVEVGIWRDEGGNVALFIAGSKHDKTAADHWTRVGSTMLPTIPAKVVT